MHPHLGLVDGGFFGFFNFGFLIAFWLLEFHKTIVQEASHLQNAGVANLVLLLTLEIVTMRSEIILDDVIRCSRVIVLLHLGHLKGIQFSFFVVLSVKPFLILTQFHLAKGIDAFHHNAQLFR